MSHRKHREHIPSAVDAEVKALISEHTRDGDTIIGGSVVQS